jgi:hypothetical protein
MAREQWLHLSDFMALADIRGIDPVVAARDLLIEITRPSNSLPVFGIRRLWEYPSQSIAEARGGHLAEARLQEINAKLDALVGEKGEHLAARQNELLVEATYLKSTIPTNDEQERLPRDPHLRPIGLAVWDVIDTVAENGTSAWQDDPDDPYMWVQVDWFAGRIKQRDFEMRMEFNALRLERERAFEVLDRLAVFGPDVISVASPPDQPIGLERTYKLLAERETRPQRRPRVGDAQLEQWWKGLAIEQRNCSYETLEKLASDAFPENHVARDRVRALVKRDFPYRRSGPRGHWLSGDP